MTEPPALVKVSWSRLRNHDECPAKGDLLYRGHKSPVSDIRSYFHGMVADRLMGRWLEQDPPEPGWMAAHVDEFLESEEITARETGDGVVRWRTPGDKDEVRALVLELVIRLEEILGVICLPFDWVPHWRFQVPVSIDGREIILIGEADLLVFDNQGRIAVWDLKATKDNSYYQKVLGQIAFYCIAVRACQGVRCGEHELGSWPYAAGLIQPMCDQRVLPVTVGEPAIREMMGRIERTARDIMAGRLAPKPGDRCQWCEVNHACPAFKIPAGGGRVRIAV